jgi:hypothetical protein
VRGVEVMVEQGERRRRKVKEEAGVSLDISYTFLLLSLPTLCYPLSPFSPPLTCV